MELLGKKEEFLNLEKVLQPLTLYNRPQTLPSLGENEALICIYNQFIHKKLYWCATVEDMQQLYDAADMGGGFVSWYKAPFSFVDVNTVEIMHLDPS